MPPSQAQCTAGRQTDGLPHTHQGMHGRTQMDRTDAWMRVGVMRSGARGEGRSNGEGRKPSPHGHRPQVDKMLQACQHGERTGQKKG